MKAKLTFVFAVGMLGLAAVAGYLIGHRDGSVGKEWLPVRKARKGRVCCH